MTNEKYFLFIGFCNYLKEALKKKGYGSNFLIFTYLRKYIFQFFVKKYEPFKKSEKRLAPFTLLLKFPHKYIQGVPKFLG